MDELLRNMNHPLVLPIVTGISLGLLAYVLSRWSAFACKVLALAAVAAILWQGAAILNIDEAATFNYDWVTLSKGDADTPAVVFGIDLARTPLGMLVFFASAGFALLITIYSLSAMRGTYWEGKFYTYLIWALSGTCIVALAGNLLVLLVGWEIVTLMLFLMINQGKGDAKGAAAKA